MVYGFHDMAPRLQIASGGTYGVPYSAMCVKGIENLLACGMMITSDRRAHMSTRNTVCCMGQAQGAAPPPPSAPPATAAPATCPTARSATP